jgi:hypothetical protein
MIDKLPPGDWHFAGGYNAVQVGDIKKIRKENDMTEKKTASVRKQAIEEMVEHYKNTPPWSPLRDIPEPERKPQIVCGTCGKSTPYAADGKDIIFVHKCEPDREFIDTMKKITFKLLGIDTYNQAMQQFGEWNSVQMPQIKTEEEVRKELGLEAKE